MFQSTCEFIILFAIVENNIFSKKLLKPCTGVEIGLINYFFKMGWQRKSLLNSDKLLYLQHSSFN